MNPEMTARVELALTDKGNGKFGAGFNHDKAMGAIPPELDEEYRIETDFYVEPMLSQSEFDALFSVKKLPIMLPNLGEKIEVGSDKWMDAQDQKSEMKHD